MKIICKLFNHKFNYFITQDTPQHNFRCCKQCGKMQEFKELPFGQKDWVSLVQRTEQGALQWIKENPVIKKEGIEL